MTRPLCSAVTIAEKGGDSTVENMLTVVGAKEKKFSMAIRCGFRQFFRDCWLVAIH